MSDRLFVIDEKGKEIPIKITKYSLSVKKGEPMKQEIEWEPAPIWSDMCPDCGHGIQGKNDKLYCGTEDDAYLKEEEECPGFWKKGSCSYCGVIPCICTEAQWKERAEAKKRQATKVIMLISDWGCIE